MEKLDEGPENIIDLGEERSSTAEDPESFYESKLADMEERFEADKRQIEKNRRLKSKKGKFDAKVRELQIIQEEMEEEMEDEKDETFAASAGDHQDQEIILS